MTGSGRPGQPWARRMRLEDAESHSIVLSDAELKRVRVQLDGIPWYRSVFETFRSRVDELIEKRPAIPLAKGRAFYESCPVDHAQLVFDPYAADRHVCPKCGRAWTGELYDLAWLRQFQGWLAKRLVEAGILYRVEGDERYARLVAEVYRHFVAHYHRYPLTNNLLGPTRLFQSTFLEAFWLVDMAAAYDLTHRSSAYTAADHVAVRQLLYESCGIVRSFDEGVSNRQAFNNAGMGAVALLFGDDAILGHVLQGPHGFAFHMRESLLEDGIWYEGETYHFATLDHLLNLAEMARHRGVDLYGGSSGFGSLRPMFDGPLRVMLPDLTFPSRKDSWFGRGIGYHREIYELGFARYGDPRFGGLLAHAYANGQDRSDMGWRTFLYLEPELPSLVGREEAGRRGQSSEGRHGDAVGPADAVRLSDLRATGCERMPGTGAAVLRRDAGRVYVGLEYGHYGGGHGHPDRLHLTLYADGVHWLLDPGTGWYHVPELAWYRSTLAHNTVTADGASQNPTEGRLEAFGSAGGFGVVQAVVPAAYPGTVLRRTLCLCDGFLLDAFDVEAEDDHSFDWAFHARGSLTHAGSSRPRAEPLAARGGHPFLRDLRDVDAPSIDAVVRHGSGTLRVLQREGADVFLGEAMGVPLREEVPFHTVISRRRGRRVRFSTVWLWGERARAADAGTETYAGPAVRIGDGSWRLHVDDAPGACVSQTAAGRLRAIAWFGRDAVEDAELALRCDWPLEAAGLRWHGETLEVDLPDPFGRVRLSGASVPATRDVRGLPAGATWRWEDGDLVLCGRPELHAWMVSGGTNAVLPAGMDGEVRFRVARYRGAEVRGSAAADDPDRDGAARSDVPSRPTLSLPETWALQELALLEGRGELASWTARVGVPPDAAGGRIEVRVDEDVATLAVETPPPLSVAWRVQAGDDGAEIQLIAHDRSGKGGRVWGEVRAPWLTAAPHCFTLDLSPGATGTTSLPLPRVPVPPVPLTETPGLASTPELGAPEENAGEFEVEAQVAMERFVGASRARFPLTWCLRRQSPSGVRGERIPVRRDAAEEAWGSMRLDRPEQAYWAETPWGGPADASAHARLEWDADGLYLACEVRDDRHVSDANDEDLYENDSLQLYLDFRAPALRDSAFAPGVAAFILAPDAERSTLRVEPISGSRELANRGLAAPWFTTDGLVAGVEPQGDGYRVSAFFPYESLGIGPLRAGDVFRADLSLSDNDGGWYRRTQLVWSGARGDRRCYLRWAYLDPAEYGYVVVGDG